MMSFALMGCMIFSASDASAQGRSRSQGGSSSSRSQSAAVSRSSSSTAPTVSRNTDRSASAAVSRNSSTSTVSRSSSAAAPQVNRSNSGSSTTRTGSGTRTSSGATTRSSSDTGIKSTVKEIPHDAKSTASSIDRTATKSSTALDSRTDVLTKSDKDRGGNKGGNMDNGRGGGKDRGGNKGGNVDNGRGGGKDRDGNKGGNVDNGGGKDRGGKDRDGNRPGSKPGSTHKGDRGDKGGKHGGNHGYNPNHRYDYNDHHYRDEFRRNYTSHNWTRPLPPPVRVHRPAPWVWYRPVVPAGWRPYYSAPVIDRILDIVFGTYYYDSLNHLYINGYYIDGYADDVIYLREVPLLGLYWSDAMLNYRDNRFANAQFVYYSDRYDDTRYNIVMHKLSRIYGTPVCRDDVTVSWYGSDGIGYVTLSMMSDYTGYYTTMSIGY